MPDKYDSMFGRGKSFPLSLSIVAYVYFDSPKDWIAQLPIFGSIDFIIIKLYANDSLWQMKSLELGKNVSVIYMGMFDKFRLTSIIQCNSCSVARVAYVSFHICNSAITSTHTHSKVALNDVHMAKEWFTVISNGSVSNYLILIYLVLTEHKSMLSAIRMEGISHLYDYWRERAVNR